MKKNQITTYQVSFNKEKNVSTVSVFQSMQKW